MFALEKCNDGHFIQGISSGCGQDHGQTQDNETDKRYSIHAWQDGTSSICCQSYFSICYYLFQLLQYRIYYHRSIQPHYTCYWSMWKDGDKIIIR